MAWLVCSKIDSTQKNFMDKETLSDYTEVEMMGVCLKIFWKK